MRLAITQYSLGTQPLTRHELTGTLVHWYHAHCALSETVNVRGPIHTYTTPARRRRGDERMSCDLAVVGPVIIAAGGVAGGVAAAADVTGRGTEPVCTRKRAFAVW